MNSVTQKQVITEVLIIMNHPAAVAKTANQ
jgi:hypothetical protein